MAEPGNRRGKWRWFGASLLVIVAGLGLGTWLNVSSLARKVASGSVPGLDFESLDLGWHTVEVRSVRYQLRGSTDLSIACRSLRAEPSFFSFLTNRVRIADVEVDEPRIRIERAARAAGETNFGLVQGAASVELAEAGETRSVKIRELVLKRGSGTFVDRTVGSPPVQVLFGRLEGTLRDLEWPEQEGRSEVSLNCVVHGDPDGSLELGGWFDPAARSADLTLRLSDCDLNLLHPYLKGQLHTVSETPGIADLDLEVLMTDGLYEARGELRLREMKIPASSEKFLGVPARFLREYLKLGSDRLTIPFTFRGNFNEEPFPPNMGTILAGVLSGRLKLSPSVTPEQLDKIDKGLKKLKDLLR